MRERTSRSMREEVLKNTGVGNAIDLRRRAQVDHLDVPAEAGVRCREPQASIRDARVVASSLMSVILACQAVLFLPSRRKNTRGGVKQDQKTPIRAHRT